jgi:hypothetical protein
MITLGRASASRAILLDSIRRKLSKLKFPAPATRTLMVGRDPE